MNQNQNQDKEKEQENIPTLIDLKCKHCGMPQTGAYYTLSDGKSYVWHNDCIRNHNHEFV